MIDLLVQLVIFKIQIKVFMIFLSFTLSFKTRTSYMKVFERKNIIDEVLREICL